MDPVFLVGVSLFLVVVLLAAIIGELIKIRKVLLDTDRPEK